MKNITAIEKIIATLAYRDYRAANPLVNKKLKYKKYHPYSLGTDTNEARQIRDDYLNDVISEEEYKAWCLRWNLTHKDMELPDVRINRKR